MLPPTNVEFVGEKFPTSSTSCTFIGIKPAQLGAAAIFGCQKQWVPWICNTSTVTICVNLTSGLAIFHAFHNAVPVMMHSNLRNCEYSGNDVKLKTQLNYV